MEEPVESLAESVLCERRLDIRLVRRLAPFLHVLGEDDDWDFAVQGGDAKVIGTNLRWEVTVFLVYQLSKLYHLLLLP